MILGAQLYSLRRLTQTEGGVREVFRRVKEIGYDAVQVSAFGRDIPAELIAALSTQYDLPVTVTHTPPDRILGETDKVIEEHKLFGCMQIGLGWVGTEYRGCKANVQKLIDTFAPAVAKIQAAGLTFAYHNHDFEFDPLEEGGTFYDYLIANTDWSFIPDVYWLSYAGLDAAAMLRRLQGRVLNVHFKDMASSPKGPICACGNGVIDFAPLVPVCEETGIRYCQVEQDNAADFIGDGKDEFTQMKISYDHLRPLIYHEK